MARISTTEANQALATTGWSYVSLHTGDPSTTGANEVTGGTYARVAVTWNSPSSGTVTQSNALSINLPASTTVSYFGVWSASQSLLVHFQFQLPNLRGRNGNQLSIEP